MLTEIREAALRLQFIALSSDDLGFSDLPRQMERISKAKGFDLTIMVVGEAGLGKSTLINNLFSIHLYEERIVADALQNHTQTIKCEVKKIKIEEGGVKLKLTVVDTPGFGDSVDNSDCIRPISRFIDEQHQRFARAAAISKNLVEIEDSRINCLFYFIAPTYLGLKPLDIKFLKELQNKVNIVPIIAKADYYTKTELEQFKNCILKDIEFYGLRVYMPNLFEEGDRSFREKIQKLQAAVPFAVCGGNAIIQKNGKYKLVRQYPWGQVEVENPDHCDFTKLRSMLVIQMHNLRELTDSLHYDNYPSENLVEEVSYRAKPKSENQQKIEMDKWTDIIAAIKNCAPNE